MSKLESITPLFFNPSLCSKSNQRAVSSSKFCMLQELYPELLLDPCITYQESLITLHVIAPYLFQL